ncbi:Retrovirus-related Pol polyprotein from type-1 retrotransposable element R2 [Symbiodinium microadriaticum]|uniref:Retrovirus-related Pol polyprotein from type-1 retrotransposable element R2 n=1 Tax=Symbiodinium microadriaticum TaxID=2951 RepID=A0A1Q9CVY0_SYMMI|nr:Retrovirus-related Pol polyprotein from type-1 retrotransposable element R2 [Symbiodinium microadriaticum]
MVTQPWPCHGTVADVSDDFDIVADVVNLVWSGALLATNRTATALEVSVCVAGAFTVDVGLPTSMAYFSSAVETVGLPMVLAPFVGRGDSGVAGLPAGVLKALVNAVVKELRAQFQAASFAVTNGEEKWLLPFRVHPLVEAAKTPAAPEVVRLSVTVPKVLAPKDLWESFKDQPGAQLKSWCERVCPAALRQSFSWRETTLSQKGRSVVVLQGLAVVDKTKAEGLLDCSGQGGVFFCTDKASVQKKVQVKWMQSTEAETMPAYLKRVQDEARKSGLSIAWRVGDPVQLGLRCKPGTGSATPGVTAAWRVRKVPASWTEEDLLEALASAGWHELSVTKRPRPVGTCDSDMPVDAEVKRKLCFSLRIIGKCKGFRLSSLLRSLSLREKPLVRMRKRQWWLRLKNTDVLEGQEFLRHTGLTTAQVDELVGCNDPPTARQQAWAAMSAKAKAKANKRKPRTTQGGGPRKRPASRLSSAQSAKHRLGGHRAERVGEAKHPGPGAGLLSGSASALSFLCLNTGGAVAAWTYVREHLAHDRRDVVCLQETGMSSSEADGFLRTASRSGYSGYSQGSDGAHGRAGGVITLVRKTIPQRPSWGGNMSDAEVLGVWVGGWMVVNMYAHPHEHGPSQAGTLLLDLFIADKIPPQQPWVLMGHHNELPSDPSVMGVARALGREYHGTGQPTRWEGRREIDWIACNRPDAVSSVSFGSDRISDHKDLRFQLAAAYTPVRVGVLPRTGRPPEVTTDQWRAALASAWAASPQVGALHSSLRRGCTDVQKLWDEFQRALRQTFVLAFQSVQVQPPPAAKLQAKGGRATVSWENQACNGPRLNPGLLKLNLMLMRTASVVEGAQAIYDYWQNFWRRLDRTRPALQARTAALLATVPSPETAVVFPLPRADALQRRARRSTGSGSPDGWLGSELKHLPLPVFETFAQLADVWVSAGSVPAQFTEARMICIPKTVTDRVCDTASTRPNTVMSTWWRLWVSTLYHSDAIQTWMRSVLLPEIAAINGEDLYVTLLRVFEQLAEQGMVLALDFTKAFDALDARVTIEMLRKLKWPPDLLRVFSSVWMQLARYIQFQHHCHPEPLVAGVQPQGDPLGPLIMALWAQAGLLSVRGLTQAQSAQTTVYVDDRTIVAREARVLSLQEQSWAQWSASVGLLEHPAKTEATAITAALTRSLAEPVLWTLMRGTAPAALNAWLIDRGWLLAGPWRWSHPFAGLRLDLTAGRGPMTQKALKDRTFDLWQAGGQGLRNLNWPDLRRLREVREWLTFVQLQMWADPCESKTLNLSLVCTQQTCEQGWACIVLSWLLVCWLVTFISNGNTAIESASADKELATVKYERKKKSQVETLRKIFEELDSSSADNISIKDVETAMSRGRLSNFLESMGISTEDVWTFFMLIDANENGLLDLDEFVSGCMQLNGPARSIQLAKMSYENKVTRREIRNIMEELKQVSEQVSGVGVSPQVMEGRRKRAMLSEAF